MASLDRQFRTLLHAHLERSGTSGRRFGIEALKDPGFVASLGKGRKLGLKTADSVLAFIGLAPLAPAFRREAEAFLLLTGTKAYVLGEESVNDPSFVERLRRGASFRLETVERVRAWMGCHAGAAALAAMRDAVAGTPLFSDGDGPSGDCGEQGDHDMKKDDSDYLSTRRAAAVLGLSPRTLDRYRLSGEGPAHYRFGMRIAVHADRTVHVNGVPLGRAKTHALDGRALDAVAPGIVPPEHYYVHGDHHDSHDSRYAEIGLVPRDRILGRAVALPDLPWLGLDGPLVGPEDIRDSMEARR